MENQKLFIELSSILNTKGANISMERLFQDGIITYLNIPEVKEYVGPKGNGFCFRANHKYFGISESELADLFPITINNHIINLIEHLEFEIESGNDRYYPESFAFSIE